MNKRRVNKIAIVGSREFPSRAIVEQKLYEIKAAAKAKNIRLHIITGGCRGVDTWAIEWALTNQIMFTVIPAEWNLLGNSAGYTRNHEIWNIADKGLAFWDGQSPGTKHNFDLAARRNKQLIVIYG